MAPPPTLCEAARAAVHCWAWCGGWQPALWPAYGALHDVADWQMVMELMQHIRREVG